MDLVPIMAVTPCFKISKISIPTLIMPELNTILIIFILFGSAMVAQPEQNQVTGHQMKLQKTMVVHLHVMYQLKKANFYTVMTKLSVKLKTG